MKSLINNLERLALRVSRFISNLSGIAVLWIIAITCVDVVGRYFFNSPLYAGSEMVQVSMAFVIFLSLPGLFFKNENIIVDLFPFFKKGYVGWVMGGVFLAATAYCLWIIAGKTYSYAKRSLEDGDTYEYIILPGYAFDHSPLSSSRILIHILITHPNPLCSSHTLIPTRVHYGSTDGLR